MNPYIKKIKINKKRQQKYIELINNITLEMAIAFCSDYYWKGKLDALLLESTIDIS